MLKVCQIAFYLYCDPKDQRDDSWAALKVKLLGDMRLLDGLRNFEISSVKGETSKRAKAGIAQLTKAMGGATGPELVTALKKSSQSAAGLYKWASATDKYYDIFRMVEPRKKLAEDMQRKSNRATEELNATLAALQ